MMKAPRRLWFLALAALSGFVLSVWQSNQFYAIRNGSAGFRSFCNLNSKLNCDAVMASKFAEFAFGFPLSSFAAAWFLTLVVIALIARNPFWRRDAVRMLFGMTLFGSVMSLVYLAVMSFVLDTYCLFCIFVDAINFAGLGIALSLKPEGLGEHPFDKGRLKTMMGTAFAAVVVVVPMISIVLNSSTIPDAEAARLAEKILTSAPLPVRSGEEFTSIGPKDAPVTIVEFSDFQCPYCRLMAMSLHHLANRYPGKLRIVFRNYPLDAACNPEIKRVMHQYACESARVAHCAHKQGKFEETYSLIFEDQSTLAPGVPARIAAKAGVDPTQLEACVNDPATAMAIARDIEEGRQLQVESTPTLFFNGHKVEGGLPTPVLERIIDGLLAQAAPAATK